MNDQNKFWGIIELFGHAMLAGEISKSEVGEFIQVNIPEIGPIPKWTKLLNPKAIYAITPTSKETAIDKATSIKSMPIDKWDTERLISNRFSELEQEGKIKMVESALVDDDIENDTQF